jgi:xanthine/CO dehydrogenase XdhC/CoxF family maturation factor
MPRSASAIGARSPEEVAVAIGAEIVEATALARRRATADTGGVSLLSA